MGKRQPVQQPPPVQKVRLRYTKRGAARFTSHRDFGRALERALRRAEVPMAYSSGFSPHPRISYANASPTGAASEAEYVELGLSEQCSPERLAEALNEVLPSGFLIADAAEARKESLGELLQASDWTMVLTADEGVLSRAAAALLAMERCDVERMTKNGLRTFDVRGSLVSLRVLDQRTLAVRLRHGIPLVRPDDVLTALRHVAPEVPPSGLLTRVAQGPLEGEEIGDPLR